MPLGNALPGNNFRVLIAAEATPSTFVPLGLMHDSDVSVDEQVNEFEVFDSDDPITMAGKPKRVLTLAGYLGDADSGQAIALAAAAAKTKPILKFLWDGANGFTQEVRVTAYKGSPKAGNQPIDLTFDFRATKAVGTIVGAGPLL